MKKRNNIINIFSIIIFISIFPFIISNITQFNSIELETYDKFINNYNKIDRDIKIYEIKMKKIRINFKLRSKFRKIKKLNAQLSSKIITIQKIVNSTDFNKKEVSKEINTLSNDLDILTNKFITFQNKYKSYQAFKANILAYIKIFFICFFSVIIIMLIALIIVGIIVYRKRDKYYTLHEEISVKQEIKNVHDIKNLSFGKNDKSEERKFRQEQESYQSKVKEKIEVNKKA